MDDHLLVEALRARDPGAAGAVYDAYADRLYAYCWFQLRCRDAAQVALRDTFIVAEAHAGKLRDPDRFGPWLYALARLECARRPPRPGQEPDLPVASHDQDDVDQRMMAWQAVLGLAPDERELLELRVRHQLSVPDLAAVQDLPVKDAQDALDAAHAALETALTAEIVAHSGPYGCDERGRLLRERRGELDRELRERLAGHARDCGTCAELLPRTVSAAKVFGLLPCADLPPELRVRVMSAFMDPDLVGYRLFVATRVDGLGPSGFPLRPRRGRAAAATERSRRDRRSRRRDPGRRPEVPLPDDSGRRRSVAWLAVGAVAAALLLSSGAALLRLDGRGTGHPQAVVTGDLRPPDGGSSARPGRSAGGPGVPVSATFPLGALVPSAPPTALPSPPPGGGTGGGEHAPPPGEGALAVSPLFLDLAGGSDGTVELRAGGGPVDWRARTWGPVRASRTSGRLEAGETARIAVRVSRSARSQGEGGIAFTPGGAEVRVTWRPAPGPGPSPDPTPTTPAPEPTPTPTPTPSPTRPPAEPSSPPPSTPPDASEPAPPPGSGGTPAPSGSG
ncbi:sigma-70 family RNA polymerase sigma factor [Spirillospora sp. NPDC029432]|uniref:RNA polymerase sigma factor n=1 Tax=Spirillospora sp. NPDC029432 TaxID=3154599 RepID=UPI0034524CBD